MHLLFVSMDGMRVDRGDKFLELHKAFETHIRQRLRLSKQIPYRELLDKMIEKGDSTIRRNLDFLRVLGDLRNILSHALYGTRHLAEPSEQTLRDFEKIVSRIVRPPLLRDVASKPVDVFDEDNTLSNALADMKRNDYSQIVFRKDGHLGLITPEGVTCWILRESAGVGLIEPAAVSLKKVCVAEPKASCRFMRPDQTVDEARAAFLEGSANPSTRLYAILITHSAKATEQALGIVTPWDVFEH
jgi:hypothetical protein